MTNNPPRLMPEPPPSLTHVQADMLDAMQAEAISDMINEQGVPAELTSPGTAQLASSPEQMLTWFMQQLEQQNTLLAQLVLRIEQLEQRHRRDAHSPPANSQPTDQVWAQGLATKPN